MKIYNIPVKIIEGLINPYLKGKQRIIDIDCDSYYNTIIVRIGMGYPGEDGREYTKLIIIDKYGGIEGEAIFISAELHRKVKKELRDIIKKV